MINNLKSVSGERFGAREALECLSLSKTATGRSQRDLIVDMILYAFDKSPEYKSIRDLVITQTNREEKAKRCLTVLRNTCGQTEQSLIASMVKYAFNENPEFRESKQSPEAK